MPYSGPSDKSLPKNVKELGDKQRRQWVHIFNSTHAACQKKGGEDCESVAFERANGVLKKGSSFVGLLGGESPLGRSFIEFAAAEPPDTINVFPAPGTYKHPVWGDLEVTKEGNQLFVDNFNAHVYQEHVPIDAEHETQLSGAVGYLKALSLNEDDSIEASVDWTERGQKLIESDSFKYISPAWFEEWSDPATGDEFENVMIGAALTTRPFFKDQALRSLVASEGRLFDIEEGGVREPVIKSAIEGVSYEDLRTMLLSAARNTFPGVIGTGDYSGWVTDLYDDHVIIEGSGRYWDIDYSYTDDAIAFSGQPKEVIRKSFWEDAPQQAKEADEEHTKHTPNKPKSKSKEGNMAELEKVTSEVEALDEEEKKTLFQKVASMIGITVEVKQTEEEEETHDDDSKDDDPAPDAKTAAEFAGLKTSLETERKAREEANKRVGVLEAAGRVQRFRDIVLGRDDDGVRAAKEEGATALHPMVGEHAAKMLIMERLGEGTDEFKAYVASERENAARLHAAGTFGEVGQDSHDGTITSSAKEEMEKRIAAEMTGDNPVKTREEAIVKIAADDPKLMNAYDQEVTQRKQAFRATE